MWSAPAWAINWVQEPRTPQLAQTSRWPLPIAMRRQRGVAPRAALSKGQGSSTDAEPHTAQDGDNLTALVGKNWFDAGFALQDTGAVTREREDNPPSTDRLRPDGNAVPDDPGLPGVRRSLTYAKPAARLSK